MNSSKKGAIVFGVLVVALVIVDHFAWKAADLQTYVGKLGGVSAPIDNAVHGLVGGIVRRHELEKMLDNAENVKDYGHLSQKLFDHMGKAGDTEDQFPLMLKTMEKYGGENDKNIIKAEKYLAKQIATAKKKGDLGKVLANLRKTALKPKVDSRTLEEILRWAKTGDRINIYEDYAEEFHKLGSLKPELRLSMVLGLVSHYEKTEQPEKLKEAKEFEAKYMQMAQLDKVAKKQASTALNTAKKGNVDEAANILKATLKKFPQFKSKYSNLYLDIVREANKFRSAKNLPYFWGLLKDAQELNKDKLDSLTKVAKESIGVMLQANQVDLAFKIADLASERSEDFKQMDYYLAGEKWARTGMKGDCPKKTYTISYRPNADITIDGDMDEEVYKNVPGMPGPYWSSYEKNMEIMDNAGTLSLQSQMLYTDTHLYIAVKCPDPFTGLVKKTFRYANSNAWQDDSIEFFMDTHRTLDYQQFVGTTLGATWRYTFGPSAGLTKEEKEAKDFECKAKFAKNYYSLEMKIPLSYFPLPDKPSGTLVNGYLRRNRWLSLPMKRFIKDKKAARQLIAWSKVQGGAHSMWYADFLKFE